MFQPPPPKPSPEAIDIANRLPVLKYYLNPANRKFRNSIRNNIVLHDEQGLCPIFIQTHLHKVFPIQGWCWIARALSSNNFLVEPPNEEWKKIVLSQRELILGGVRFVAELYNFRKFRSSHSLGKYQGSSSRSMERRGIQEDCF
jgi:hypothetical protein